MKSLISVIVPVYKVEDYLTRCVKSILNQSYTNLEILLIDDGSPDRCGQICEELAKVDSRIRVFHKKNGGLSDARNYGTERAKGEFVTYVDSDDFISEKYLERLLQVQQKHGADIVCCDFVKTTDDYGNFSDTAGEELSFTGREACCALMGQHYMPLVVACCKIYRREIAQSHLFPVGKVHEDEATTCKFFYDANRVVLCADKLYGYYQNPDSITHDGKTSNYSKKLWALSARAEFFDNVGDYELANRAWSFCVLFLTNQAVMQKKNLSESVLPFVREHCLWKRMDKKVYIKLFAAWIMPKVLKKWIEANL